MTFMILLKLYVWGKPNSQVKCKNALSQPGGGIFKLYYLKHHQRYKVEFLHAGTYLLKLQIDDCRWVWSGMPRHVKRAY